MRTVVTEKKVKPNAPQPGMDVVARPPQPTPEPAAAEPRSEPEPQQPEQPALHAKQAQPHDSNTGIVVTTLFIAAALMGLTVFIYYQSNA